MKLKFEHEHPFQYYNKEDYRGNSCLHWYGFSSGYKIYEISPSNRTIFIYNKKVRLPLPNLIFIVRYIVKSNQRVFYPGIYGTGLQLYATKNPLKSFNDDVFLFFTDFFNQGSVCTDHQYDGFEFDSPHKLCQSVVNFWFGLNHHNLPSPLKGFSDSQFESMIVRESRNGTLDLTNKSLKFDYFGTEEPIKPGLSIKPIGSLRSALISEKRYGTKYDLFVPEDANILD